MVESAAISEAAALLASGLYAGVAHDVVIVYYDEALREKTTIPANDAAYPALKRAIEKHWRFVSRLSNGVKIYQRAQ